MLPDIEVEAKLTPSRAARADLNDNGLNKYLMRGTSSSAMMLRKTSQSCGAALTTSELVAGSAVTLTGLENSGVRPAELAPPAPPPPPAPP